VLRVRRRATEGGQRRHPTLVDAAALGRLRERRFRQVPSRRVRTEQSAAKFVEEVGLASTFYRFPEGVACLWEAVVGRADPRWPRRSHHDEGVGVTWDLKDRLPARKRVYYGKLLRGRPVLVALDVFAAFYAVVRGAGRARDYRTEYEAGRLSHTARRVMDVLVREHPQYTRGLRANTFMLEPGKTREFERAVAELQQGLWVMKTEERYEPTFSYRWDLVESWLPDAVAEGRRLRREVAVDRLIDRYLGGAVYTAERSLARLFGVRGSALTASLDRLARRGAIVQCEVDGWPGEWIVHRSALSRR
jgi:hypothetical protein